MNSRTSRTSITPEPRAGLGPRPLGGSFLALALTLALTLVGCGPSDDSPAIREARAASIERQPIPAGVDPRMVEWRSDGLLVPSADSLRRTPGYVIDSVFPPDEAIRRFQATVAGPAPARLVGGARDPETLLRRYWSALVAHDTVAVRTLVVDHAEFAYLYFPESAPFASGMQPAAAWILYESQTGRGLSRAFRAATDRREPVASTVCREQGRDEGKGRTFGPCGVVLRTAQRSDTLWIAATLLRRDGVVKFLGLDNAL